MRISCKEATQMISRSMDLPLPMGKRILLKIHLIYCSICARYSRQLGLLRKILVRYRERQESNDDVLSVDTKKNMQDLIDKELSRTRL